MGHAVTRMAWGNAWGNKALSLFVETALVRPAKQGVSGHRPLRGWNQFEAAHGLTKEDWDAVSDDPERTETDFRQAKPFSEAFPELAEGLRKSAGLEQ